MDWPKRFSKEGYNTNLIFLSLKNVEHAKERVEQRVKVKGHGVPENQIEERYKGSLSKVNKHFKEFSTFSLFEASDKQIKPILYMEKGIAKDIHKDIPPHAKVIFKPIFTHIEKTIQKK
ncbi:MAG: hypothetical protein K2X86_15485 [Cytophagaceae bacterium]|nr:hypothetical protein [Cytophagaceae bacterium]